MSYRRIDNSGVFSHLSNAEREKWSLFHQLLIYVPSLRVLTFGELEI